MRNSRTALPVRGHDRRSLRSAALRGAFLASTLLIGITVLRQHFDAWLIVGALVALAASAFVTVCGSRNQAQPVSRVSESGQRRAGADGLLDSIPDPVILVDRRAVVVDANGPARALLPALKSRHPLSFALRVPDVLDGIDQVFKTGQALRAEYTERVPTELAFEVRIGALRTDAGGDGSPSNVVLFFRDLTAARRLEHMRVDFIANASHELRTPLASMLGFIETLQGPARNDPAARERFLEIMREQARRMSRLIDDLLSLSRIELRAHVPPSTPVDLVPLVNHIVEAFSPLAEEKGIGVTVSGPAEGLTVLGERDELLRMIENLIENAVKYGDSGGRVEVILSRSGGGDRPAQVELAVRDDGPGIAPEHLPRLTERFYRVDVVKSRSRGGTGLGLAIVKHIVNRHRGRLQIESEFGQGATFRVQLPEHRADPPG